MELYDMHCHVDLMPDMMTFAEQTLVEKLAILAVTTTPKAYAQELTMLRHFTNIRVALGLHPQLVSERYGELTLVEKHIADANYVGEVGLDYNRQFYSSKQKQLDVFTNIMKWCGQYSGKVISIHSVHADKTVLDIIEKYACTNHNKCILHWFSGTISQLQRAIEMNCLFSVNSAMTKSENGQKIIRNIPIDNIVIETDAPFIGGINDATKLRAEVDTTQTTLAALFDETIHARIGRMSKTLLSV